jgi:hypothetical protein
MSNNQPISTFRRLPRRKQINNFLIEQENHIQSIGDTPIVHDILEQILLQPSININHNDYIYMIYLLLLIIFYIYYIIIILQEKPNEQYYYFDNYEHEIPLLLWFKKGYRLH